MLAEAETSAYHVCTGVAPDLMEASKRAVRAMIDHLGRRHGLEPRTICGLLGRLRPAHPRAGGRANWVVGAFLPEDVFE